MNKIILIVLLFAISTLNAQTNITFSDTDNDGVLSRQEVFDKIMAAGSPSEFTAVVDNSIHTIYPGAFGFVSGLTSLSMPNVTIIGEVAFEGCSVVDVNMPIVRTIGEFAFQVCESLISIVVDPDNEYFSTIDGVLFDKALTTLIVYPCSKKDDTYIVPKSVKTIEKKAFTLNKHLVNLIMPNVMTIGEHAFRHSHIASIDMPNIVTIGPTSFFECNVDKLNIPNIESIGGSAFGGCDKLTSVNMPFVKTIEGYAFGRCSSLKELWILSDRAPEFPDGIFYDVQLGAISLYIKDGATGYEVYPWSEMNICKSGYYTVNSSSVGGVISPGRSVNVLKGMSQMFVVSPDYGYEISEILVDGVKVDHSGVMGSYTLETINNNHTIEVICKGEEDVVDELTHANVKIFTFNKIVNIEYDDDEKINYEIIDILGQTVSYGEFVNKLQISIAKHGVYIVKIMSGRKIINAKKIII